MLRRHIGTRAQPLEGRDHHVATFWCEYPCAQPRQVRKHHGDPVACDRRGEQHKLRVAQIGRIPAYQDKTAGTAPEAERYMCASRAAVRQGIATSSISTQAKGHAAPAGEVGHQQQRDQGVGNDYFIRWLQNIRCENWT